jgi:hypothetical protein
MVERVVRSLKDLEEALAVASQEGGCRIRVGQHVVALVPPDDLMDDEASVFLNHPTVVDRLNKAARSLDQGQSISHKEVLQRLGLEKS